MITQEKSADDENNLQTAHLAWDTQWADQEARKEWLTPENEVVGIIDTLKQKGARRILDLGCGVGRHAILFAESGFEVHAFDASPTGLEFLQNVAVSKKLDITNNMGLMTNLPYEDKSFDYVLSWNVIHHGTPDIIKTTVTEIRRILKTGGIFQGTILSKRNAKFGIGREIANNTFVIDEEAERKHPHFYCSCREFLELLPNFEPLSIKDKEQKKPGSFHWHFIVEQIC